nr:MAG TPA: hypothetical protein [Caudoviricetes sp.]
MVTSNSPVHIPPIAGYSFIIIKDIAFNCIQSSRHSRWLFISRRM